jgi:hypothetical protein
MVMAVVVMMMPTTVAIRLCIRRSREEGDESEHQYSLHAGIGCACCSALLPNTLLWRIFM